MPNEIQITSTLSVAKGSLEFAGRNYRIRQDQGTARAGSFTQDVGTSEESVTFGDVAPGYIRVFNLDATNFVRLRFTTTDNAIRIPAGGLAMFYLDSGVSLIAIADTATCKIQVDCINV
jgi:hypothetical protein